MALCHLIPLRCSSLFVHCLSSILVPLISGAGPKIWMPSADDVPTPATRSRGEIGCYSCVSLSERLKNSAFNSDKFPNDRNAIFPPLPISANVSRFERMFREAGMRMPKVVSRCAETGLTARPNFFGAEIRFCPNSPQRPGACVKLKGFYEGNWFVYRDCWSRMWLEPRPYHHRLSGRCYADERVQNFVGSERNVICFCEEDLCNGAMGRSNKLLRDKWMMVRSGIIILITIMALTSLKSGSLKL